MIRREQFRSRGFSLIELLVVIVILGILAAIAIPSFLKQRTKAVDASAESDARSIAIQFESYYTDGQNYPGDDEYQLVARNVTVADELVRLSPGNIPSVHVTPTAFCVSVANPGRASRSFVWQSDHGGLQSDAAADCSAYGPALN